jgi:hypothetical protein
MGIFSEIAEGVFKAVAKILHGQKEEYHQPPWPTSADRENDARAKLVRHRLGRIACQERDSRLLQDAKIARKAAND